MVEEQTDEGRRVVGVPHRRRGVQGVRAGLGVDRLGVETVLEQQPAHRDVARRRRAQQRAALHPRPSGEQFARHLDLIAVGRPLERRQSGAAVVDLPRIVVEELA